MWKSSYKLLLLAALAAPAAAKTPYGVFPTSMELFPRRLADPREIGLSAAYYRHEGKNKADVGLGHSWGMARWYGGQDLWVFQWDIEAMAYSRFRLTGNINEFETIDFFGNLPVEARYGPVAGKFMLFHESSHLGDDFIRRTGDQGFRYSIDGVRGLLSGELFKVARLYGGGGYLLHQVPNAGRSFGQFGAELTSPELGLWKNYPSRLYLAEDVQWRQQQGWRGNSRTVVGLKIGFKDSARFARVYVGHYHGLSPFGQFFRNRESYSDIGIAFDL